MTTAGIALVSRASQRYEPGTRPAETDAMIAFHELDEALRPALLAASARHFGTSSYQADDRYLDWLYRSPTSRGLCDGIVAVQDGEIVGGMHRLMLPLSGGRRLAALHNHFVDPAVRSGSGVLLLRRSVRDADVAVAPGVEEKLGPIYRRLRFHESEGAWLQKPLSYVGVAAGLVRGRLGMEGRLTLPEAKTTADGVIVTTTPTDRQIGELCARMRQAEDEDGVDWTEELVRWRYFDPGGPRHMLVRSTVSLAHAVLALGRRKGVRTVRLMDFASDGSPGWVAAVERVARRAGAALGLTFTTDPAVSAALTAAGWRPRAARTFTFATPTPLFRLSAAATDLGFEAFAADYS